MKKWLMLFVVLIVLGVSIWVLSFVPNHYSTPIVLKGTIVTTDDILNPGWVVVDNGKIQDVLSQPPNIPEAIEIDTQGIIFPGLIDLHNHISFNVFPRWQPNQFFSNRYEWREFDEYLETVSNPFENLRSRYFCEMNTYGEIRALIGGTTSILATAPSRCIKGLVRNLDHDSGFYRYFEQDNHHILNYVNFPKEVDDVQDFLLDDLSEAFFLHLAEGIDVSSSEEFDNLNALDLLSAKTVIIHGIALDSNQFKTMSEVGASLIWSPRSNIELYGQTADILSAIDHNVMIAIGPDWAITGSSSILDELHYAAELNINEFGARLSDQQLVEMVTTTPAIIAGISEFVGSISEGLFADLLIIDGNPEQPYRSLIEADASDVKLVLIDGVPLYGSLDFMEQFWAMEELSTFDIIGNAKAILSPTLLSLVDSLKTALSSEGIEIAPLIESR